jgi:insertion element IS1 protein InsB
MVECLAACPDDLYVRLPQCPTAVGLRRLEAEAAEMWRVVQEKANQQWSWIAMDAPTRQVMAFHVGNRSRDSAAELWVKIPLIYRE